MHYEKAEHVLQQMMAGDRNMYLVKDKDGRAVVTDRPNKNQEVVGELKRKPLRLMTRLVTMLLLFLFYT